MISVKDPTVMNAERSQQLAVNSFFTYYICRNCPYSEFLIDPTDHSYCAASDYLYAMSV